MPAPPHSLHLDFLRPCGQPPFPSRPAETAALVVFALAFFGEDTLSDVFFAVMTGFMAFALGSALEKAKKESQGRLML